MQFNEYSIDAQRTMNSALTHEQALCNWIMGLCGEAGETSELIKKHLFHGKELDVEKVKDELSDCLFYLNALAVELGISLADVALHNVNKLRKRYPNGFVSGGGNR